MKSGRWAVPLIVLVTVAGVLTGSAVLVAQTEHEPAAAAYDDAPVALRQAADAFLLSLDPAQRTKALFAFNDAERLNWHFVPRQRRGLPLKEMSAQP